jgi:hypothetical protein
MTATAYKLDRRYIQDSLGLQNCFESVANIFYGIQIQALVLISFILGGHFGKPIYAVVYAKHNVYVLSVV